MQDPIDPKHVRIAREAEGYYELELYAEALQRADLLLAEKVAELPVSAMRAECLRALGRWEEGVEAFERVIALNASDVAGYVGLGWCQKRAGRLERAREAMERLLAVRPGESIGLYNLACYCALDGQRERALDLLEQAVGADESYRRMALGEEDLETLRHQPRFRRLVHRDS